MNDWDSDVQGSNCLKYFSFNIHIFLSFAGRENDWSAPKEVIAESGNFILSELGEWLASIYKMLEIGISSYWLLLLDGLAISPPLLFVSFQKP